MTLVPNPLQLLNGNNKFFLFLFLPIFFASCSLFRQSQKQDKRTSTDEGTEAAVKQPEVPFSREPMDTITWTEYKESEFTPIKPEEKKEIIAPVAKDNYRIGVFVPLYANRKVDENENINRMMHFVYGMKLSSENIKKGKPNIKFEIYDVELYSGRIANMIEKDSLAGLDAFIGPFKTEDLKLLSEYCKDNKKMLLSPWNPSSTITLDNPYYLQFKPGIDAHCENIAADIVSEFSGQQIYVVTAAKDLREQSYFEYFEKSVSFQKHDKVLRQLSLLKIPSTEGRLDTTLIKNTMLNKKDVTYIIPYWSDPIFISKFLQAVSPFVSEDVRIKVYGFPHWMQFDQINYELYERLNIHLSTSSFFEPQDPAVLTFRNRFFDRYGMIPFEDAFYGSDIAVWMTERLARNELFTNLLTKDYKASLFAPIKLYPKVLGADSSQSDRHHKIDWVENRSLQIVRLKDYYFEISKK
jgi:hypothetical protein